MPVAKMVNLGLLITFAVVIHILESFIPFPLPVPGAKLGLANIITLLTLIFYGWQSALIVAFLRSVLGSIFAGTFLGFGFFFSLAGALFSTIIMALFLPWERKQKISLVAVSVLGAAGHNTAQVFMAAVFIANRHLVAMYLPPLLLVAIPTGLFTGVATIYLRKVLERRVTQ